MNNQIFEEVSCNLCGSNKTKVLYKSTLPQDLSIEVTKRFAPANHVSGHDQIVQCQHCGLVYVNPRMKPEYIWQGYSQSIDQKYISQAEQRLNTFKRVLKIVKKYKPEGKALLDVGCAAGFFLKVACDAGWKVNGLEPNLALAKFGRLRYNIPITHEDLIKTRFEANSFDVITFWDVLEHLSDPLACLQKANSLLKQGGLIFINFPDFDSIFAKLLGSKWWFISPVHIYYFNKKTLTQMLKKAGYEVVAMKMHTQTLTLGYLFERFRDYNEPIGKLGAKFAELFNFHKLPIRYYASQTLAIAKKNSP